MKVHKKNYHIRLETPAGYFVNEKDADEYDITFPKKEKLKLPGQL